MKEEFNPEDWLPKNNPPVPSAKADKQSISASTDVASEVDIVLSRIEAEMVDIAPTYADWVNVGFAFANQFGEAGRAFFQRVSRFYAGYTLAASDRQYDQCLKAQRGGITIRTFFHMAQQAGVDVKGHGAWGGEHGKSEGTKSHRERVRGGNGAMCQDSKDGQDDDGTMGTNREDGPENSALNSDQSQSSDDANNNSFSSSPPPPTTPSSSDSSPEEPPMPTLPDFIFDQLPEYFQKVVSTAASKEERDILLLGSITAISSCLTSISGNYDGKRVFPCLYLYVVAQASSGKGRLILCRNLVNPIHWEKRKMAHQANLQHEVDMREYNAAKGKDMGLEKPQKPPVSVLFIPANNSTTGFYQLLADNDGRGLIIETEGDTIAQALKTDYGNFSDGIRKAFHQESISYYRRTDREHVEIEQPSLSIILSSTIGQMMNLIPSTENGLASRFMFYYMNLQPVWKDVFAYNGEKSLDTHFNELGQEFYSLYTTLKGKDPIEFRLSQDQQQAFNAFFAQMQDKYLVLQGLDYMAIIRRLGLIAFRCMMVLTAMRIPETGDFSTKQECRDVDFESVLAIIKVLVRHASHIVSKLPEEVKPEKRANKKEKFFEALPDTFGRKEFLELAKSQEIADRTAYKYISIFCEKGLITKTHSNEYTKNVKV